MAFSAFWRTASGRAWIWCPQLVYLVESLRERNERWMIVCRWRVRQSRRVPRRRTNFIAGWWLKAFFVHSPFIKNNPKRFRFFTSPRKNEILQRFHPAPRLTRPRSRPREVIILLHWFQRATVVFWRNSSNRDKIREEENEEKEKKEGEKDRARRGAMRCRTLWLPAMLYAKVVMRAALESRSYHHEKAQPVTHPVFKPSEFRENARKMILKERAI